LADRDLKFLFAGVLADEVLRDLRSDSSSLEELSESLSLDCLGLAAEV
jgi:hypothetical protein